MEHNWKSLNKEVQEHGEIIKWGCCYSNDCNADLMNFKPQQIKVFYDRMYLDFKFLNNQQNELWSIYNIDDEYIHIHIFNTEEECINCYNDLIWDYIDMTQYNIENLKKQLETSKKSFINTDYLIETIRRE